MIYYTADLHFGHANAIKYDKRPLARVAEMDQLLIDNWNNRVADNDTVYILGDVCFRSKYPASWYLNQLKGHKVLIVGNHDSQILADEESMECFDEIADILQIKDGDRKICLCHYPLASWNGDAYGSWHVYAHIHLQKNDAYEFMKTKEKALNAGCMINNYMPVTFEEMIENNRKFQKEEG